MAAEAKQQGNDYYRSGEYEKAVAAYTQAINLASGGGDTALYLNNRAAAHLALRNLRAALADAKSAVAKDSTFAKAHARVGSVLRELGKCQEAEASYREACRLDPSNNSFKAALEDCRRSRAGLASFVQTNVQDSIMFAVRVFLLSQALFYMLPFVGKGVAGSAYSRVRCLRGRGPHYMPSHRTASNCRPSLTPALIVPSGDARQRWTEWLRAIQGSRTSNLV